MATTNISPLRGFFSSTSRGLRLIAAVSLATNVLLLALPLYSLQIFDRVLLSRSIDTLVMLTLGVLLAVAAVSFLDMLRGQLLLRLSNRLALAFESNLFQEILQQASQLGDRSLQAFKDLAALRNFIATPQGLLALIDAPLVPIYLLVVFFLHPALGFVMAVGMVLLILLAVMTERISSPLAKAAFEASQRAQRRLDDLVRGSEAVSAHGMGDAAHAYWQALQHPFLAWSSHAGTRASQLASSGKAIRLALNVAQTGIGAYLAVTDQITMGAMIAAGILAQRGLAPMETLIAASRQVIAVYLASQRLNSVLHTHEPHKAMRLPDVQGLIEMERVIYIPPGAEQATIKGVTLRLEPGIFLGLIGPSAAGKSTLGKLIVGVWPAKSGVVRLDGADVLQWNRQDFGRACGYLPQDVQLLEGSIRDNIGRLLDASDEDIVAAAQMAGAHDLIVRLPKGYNTPVGPGGSALSAGQRQRIGLARAVFGNPKLVVLDEPNANLDSDGEEALILTLNKLKGRGTTVIMITHRPSLLSAADMLAVVVDGQLQQFGPRAEILKRIQPHAVPVDRNVA